MFFFMTTRFAKLAHCSAFGAVLKKRTPGIGIQINDNYGPSCIESATRELATFDERGSDRFGLVTLIGISRN